MTAKVFVTQENTNLNYLPAEEYGEIHFLTRLDFSPVRNSLTNDQVILELRAKLKDYNPARDYIVISGSPVVSSIAFMLIREKTDTVNILRWSNRDQVYQHLMISLKPR